MFRIIILLFCLLATGCGKPMPRKPQDPMTVGKRIFTARCITCHQRDGSGTLRDRRWAADFTDPAGVLAQSDEVILQSIMMGKKGEYSRMPAFKPILTPEDANAVLGYIRKTFWKKPAE